jgi:eukaryotic-like serine/threonine-protein kinase
VGFNVGQTFGDYSITAAVDAGGTGHAYKVEHCITKRTEVMKVLSVELATDIEIKRFEREMRALARLSHSNIAALHNAIHSENQLILLMEYVEGQTLESIFLAGRLPIDTGVGYIRQMLSALGYAHQQGVVHRDVTPATVFVTQGGQVKLADFGLSKSYGDSVLTNCGDVLGSLPYLAPERVKGTTQPDRRSDLYSVGAILYEHLTGQKPFGVNRRLAPIITDSEGEPTAPSQIEPRLSLEWDEILGRALARDPAHRYQSAAEFLDAIAQLDQPARAAEPPLLGIGIAVIAGLALAMFALPQLPQFREVAPLAAPWARLHIPPPSFAVAPPRLAIDTTDTTPPRQQTALVSMPQVAKPVAARHRKYPARSGEFSVLEPHPAAAESGTSAVVPANSPVPAAAAQEVSEPVAGEGPDPVGSQTSAPAKRGFWSKLNVFKKRSSDAKEKQ